MSDDLLDGLFEGDLAGNILAPREAKLARSVTITVPTDLCSIGRGTTSILAMNGDNYHLKQSA